MENSGAKIGNILQIAESKSHRKDYYDFCLFLKTGRRNTGSLFQTSNLHHKSFPVYKLTVLLSPQLYNFTSGRKSSFKIPNLSFVIFFIWEIFLYL